MMNSSIKQKCGKKLAVQKHFTGELSSSESAQLKIHLQKCIECKQHLASLEEKQQKFHNLHPFGLFLDAAKVRSTPWYITLYQAFQKPALRPLYAMVLIFCIALPVYINYFNNSSGIRTKGQETISYVFRHDSAIYEGDNSDTFQANDEIQILYTATSSKYISLFSIDAEGYLSFYHPEINSLWSSIEVKSKNKNEHYPCSILLDDSPGNELVIAVFTSKPLLVETVKKKVGKIVSKKPINLHEIKKNVEARDLFKKGNVQTLILNKR